MPQFYSDPERENDPHALPDCEDSMAYRKEVAVYNRPVMFSEDGADGIIRTVWYLLTEPGYGYSLWSETVHVDTNGMVRKRFDPEKVDTDPDPDRLAARIFLESRGEKATFAAEFRNVEDEFRRLRSEQEKATLAATASFTALNAWTAEANEFYAAELKRLKVWRASRQGTAPPEKVAKAQKAARDAGYTVDAHRARVAEHQKLVAAEEAARVALRNFYYAGFELPED